MVLSSRLCGVVAAWFAIAVCGRGQSQPDYEKSPISYSAATPDDAVTDIRRQIAAGELAVGGNDRQVLDAVLAALSVPVESQVLVFSKTSQQRDRIRPENPRALYFSDSVYVGWVPGGVVEIAAIDPELGPVFYSVDVDAARLRSPKIVRKEDCLRCHGGTFVREIPGVFARSVFASASGEPLLRHGSEIVDDETPFGQRWGGWYVTGYHGTENHRGNTVASELGNQLVFTPTPARPDTVADFFDPAGYPAATSDVMALLVLEHQLTMQNSLTRAGLMARKMIAYQHGLQKALKEPVTDEPAYDSVKRVFASAVEDVVDRLLFRNAALLPEGVVGSEVFRKQFAQNAPRSRAGHALKDLSGRGQIFAQRCSFLIYSEAARALPETLKAQIFERLRAVLRSRDPNDRYAYLGDDEKQRIHDILIETHPDAKQRWGETPRGIGE